jgi:type I restriction enzyme S subunit
MTGTSGRQRVPPECFPGYFLVVPPPEIARRFGELAAPLLTQAKAHVAESRTLAAIRDALLPKLLNGQLRIPI